MQLELQPYVDQIRAWPRSGRHILAHFDDDAIVVYQAFCPTIADEAVVLGNRFGASFLRTRMSWIKPNFLWMMFRSGWASKANQERVLAIWLPRPFFDALLRTSVEATFDPASGRTLDEWKRAVDGSSVRLQWDPDHSASGGVVTRRALQLGLRRRVLEEYADHAILHIEDVTSLVMEQRGTARPPYEGLLTPRERVYQPSDPAAARAVGIDPW